MRKWSWCLFFLILCVGSEASGQEAEVRGVEITIVSPGSESLEIEGLLRELSDRLGVRLFFNQSHSIELRQIFEFRSFPVPILSRIWIELDPSDRCTVFIVDPHRDRVLIREVPVPSGIDAVVREQIGQIIVAAIEALQSGVEVGVPSAEIQRNMTSDAPEQPPPAEPEEPEPRQMFPAPQLAWPRTVGFDISVAYDMFVLSRDSSPVHGPFARFEVDFPRLRVNPSLQISLSYFLPNEIEGSEVGIRLNQVYLNFILGIDFFSNRRLNLGVNLGTTLQFVRIESWIIESVDLVAEPNKVETIVLFHLNVELRVSLNEKFSFFAHIGVDSDFARTQFVILRENGSDEVFHQWFMRPTFRIGLIGHALR